MSVTVKESCNRCPSWDCHTLSDERSIIQTDIASTFIRWGISTCKERLTQLLSNSNHLFSEVIKNWETLGD
jgi:hypothetical protein